MTTEDEVRLLELQLADIKRQMGLPRGRPARLVDATHGIAGEGDSRSSSDNGGGWRPMNFLQTVPWVLFDESGRRTCDRWRPG